MIDLLFLISPQYLILDLVVLGVVGYLILALVRAFRRF